MQMRGIAADQARARDWYFIAEQPAPAPHLAHAEGYAALRIVLVTVPRVSRSENRQLRSAHEAASADRC